ncbi:RecQ-mediated genome instability protein 2 [Arabidopsis suecica]|uniref:RecQ-mediated genome instability protein 2 n=1 Tax=Arabidopsis suecica TaxID=45249 RepID=A0A8T2H1T2_ARASU|nr:RecQ-mediated genome instability protein 2 [Arabidopsis suecica]
MDYSLAAVKMLCSQLRDAKPTPSQNATALGGVLFQRAWLQVPNLSSSHCLIAQLLIPVSMTSNLALQGVLVPISGGGDNSLVLDDGTGLVELGLSGDFAIRQWKSGMYVMVVGVYHIRTGDIPLLKVHKMVDLSVSPDREAMWYLEVMDAYRLFYEPLIQEFS